MNAIFSRKSVRKYDENKVEDEKIEKLLRAAMAAPSGGNQQPWHFVVVTDASTCERLGEVSPYSKPATGAPLNIIAVMDDTQARFPEIADHDMSAAVENILLEAVELGLGAVWQALYPFEDRMQSVRDLLGIPAELKPFALVSIGNPASEVGPQQDRFNSERVHQNAW